MATIKETQNPVSQKEFEKYFKLLYLYNRNHFKIPDLDEVRGYGDLWGDNFKGIKIPDTLQKGKKKRIVIFELISKKISLQKALQLFEGRGLLFPNVFGLAIAQFVRQYELPQGYHLLGIDYKENLPTTSLEDDPSKKITVLPSLMIRKSGTKTENYSHCLHDDLIEPDPRNNNFAFLFLSD